jgi:lipopolysaccharide/colanic/teichoic acid biosynthesis glycosyltransferase
MRGPVFKMKNDPRVTRIGRLLRKTSIDELPQLVSVLRGDLSLVGPRPPLQSEYRHFTPLPRRKLEVTPGLTCLWQVRGRNRIVDFEEWLAMDLAYIRDWNLLLDLKILLATIPAVLRGSGAS